MTGPGCGSACGDLRHTDQRFLACFLNSSLRGDEGVRWETRHCLSPSGTAAFSGQGFVALRQPAFTIDSNYLLPVVHLFSAIDLGEKRQWSAEREA